MQDSGLTVGKPRSIRLKVPDNPQNLPIRATLSSREHPLYHTAVTTSCVCHTCNRPAVDGTVQFRDTCAHCGADAHVCRNCLHYDEGAHHECRESSAEWVRDKKRRNTCEYFRARQQGSGDRTREKASALNALDDLFKK